MILFNSTVTKIQIISYQKNEMKKYSKNKIKMSKREDIHFYKYKKNTTQMVVFQNQNYLVLIPYFLLKRSIRPSA